MNVFTVKLVMMVESHPSEVIKLLVYVPLVLTTLPFGSVYVAGAVIVTFSVKL